MIRELTIENFKSIKKLELKPKRINLFVGEPNVGKSNILEALSLYSLPMANNPNFLKDIVRFKNVKNLFYDNNVNAEIKLRSNYGLLSAKFATFSNSARFFILLQKNFNVFSDYNIIRIFDREENKANFNKDLEVKEKMFTSKRNYLFYGLVTNVDGHQIKQTKQEEVFVRKFHYNDKKEFNSGFDDVLRPVFGENLFTIIQKNEKLMNEFASFFDEYKLNLVYDIEKNNFYIQKQIGRIIYKYPFDLIADSLKRLIFYITAIETNNNSCLLFEEPEVHSYPPYVRYLAEKIVEKSDNQYFITTHSPYLLGSIIENSNFKDLNVYITYYDDYETKVKALSKEEMREFLDLDSDVFFNFDKFLD